jgi:hypothetical protein
MPSLLSGGKALAGTTGSTSIFITLPTAQLNLGVTLSTGTGYTLVTGPNGQLGFTSTLGSVLFQDSVIKTNVQDGDLTITSNGTGTVRLTGNVRGDTLAANTGSFNYLYANTSTIKNLEVTDAISFTSVTSTATFASDLRVQQDFRVDQQLNAYGNVSLSGEGKVIDIRPQFGGSVLIRPGDTGRMDNMNIGGEEPANGRFIELTATNLTVENFTVSNVVSTTGTFQTIRVLSTASDSVTLAGGMTVTNSVVAGSVYDSGVRVISTINVGAGLAETTSTGPTVTLTNTGVLSAAAGTDISINTSTGDITISNVSTLQSVVGRGNTSSIPISITSSNASTTSDTGALTVLGGVGIGGAVHAGAIYDTGLRVVTSATVVAGEGLSGGGTLTGPNSTIALTNTGVLSLIAGTDTRVSTATGNVTVWDVSTLQSVTDRGWTSTNFIHIQNGFSQVGTGTSLSGGTWTDAVFVVDGDAGVGGNLYIQGDFYASGKAVLTTATIGASLNQGVDITIVENTTTGELTFNDIATLQSVTSRGNTSTYAINFANTTNSTSTTSGAIVIAGGVGVGKDMHIGGDVYSAGGSPVYNYKLYTPQVTVSTSSPVTARIGDFWIDPSIGVEYQYVPNGTSTVWIQFIGF